MASQPKLLDVEVSVAQREAEHYADMAAFIRQKQDELEKQGSLVLERMKASGQRLLTFTDEYKVAHRFEIIDVDERLKYMKKEPPEKQP